jgi:hypothetical protein
MPVFVACPVCGFGVQAADAVLGQCLRCSACGHAFVAAPSAVRPPRPVAADPLPALGDAAMGNGEGGPFCPGCGRRISWEASLCPHCGEELEPEDEEQRRRRGVEGLRRDYEPHRARLILNLGNLSLIVGGLSLCTFGLGALVSVPVGVLAWLMANRDLELMREGRMDPRGLSLTRTGRTGAITGIILGGLFAAFYALVILAG